jgi:hypothetical protein
MKAILKPLGIAAAVAAVTAGYSGVSHAQAALANNGLGDAAIVPYYTVEGDYVSGVHIINTSNLTQVVKLRWRRGSDSMDALDFNVILSPYDEWTGYIDDAGGAIAVRTDDASCTAPLRSDGVFPMPSGYSAGASEGYIEVIGMGSADAAQPISIAAKHLSSGVPFNCGLVESNFFRNATDAASTGDTTSKGITDTDTSNQTCNDVIFAALNGFGTSCAAAGAAIQPNLYAQTDNVLKVSFFTRDAASGLEFGNSAVHLADFSNAAMMTNQEVNVVGNLDEFGYLFPDLDGGSPSVSPRGRFEGVRSALGASSIVNDWSVATSRNVSTDWVVTLPGQYLMLDLDTYTASLFDPAVKCLTAEQAAAVLPNPAQPCDERDLPVALSIKVWDREEGTFTTPDSGLVISPATSTTPGNDTLVNEVNVIQWTDGATEEVLPSQYAKKYDVSALGADFGWASLGVTASSSKTQGIFNWAASTPVLRSFTPLTNVEVPIVGFVAWERSFPADPSANYGRIIEHSYEN